MEQGKTHVEDGHLDSQRLWEDCTEGVGSGSSACCWEMDGSVSGSCLKASFGTCGVWIFRFCHLSLVRRRDSSVSTVTRLRAGRSGVRNPGRGEINFSLFQNIHTGSRTNLALYSMDTGRSFHRGKAAKVRSVSNSRSSPPSLHDVTFFVQSQQLTSERTKPLDPMDSGSQFDDQLVRAYFVSFLVCPEQRTLGSCRFRPFYRPRTPLGRVGV
jgi:hypothetical protein